VSTAGNAGNGTATGAAATRNADGATGRPGYAPHVIEDYPRYRLRPPPRGYTWRHVDEGYLLTGPNGVIFDIIPE
jgi:Ni/Co efflux regulator RcnB